LKISDAIIEVFKSKLFCDMCRRYGGHNHLDLKQEVILIVLEIPEEKQRMIIENNYLLPYTLQIIRHQVSTSKWTQYRKKFGNRENIEFIDSFADMPETDHHTNIEPEKIISKIKADTHLQSNPFFYHSRLLEELLTNHGSTKELAKAIGIPYRSVSYAIKEYRQYLKKWANND
jgi:hypothetical protein